MATKVKQTGPPVRVGEYQISVLSEPPGAIARAVLVGKSVPIRPDIPECITMTPSGLEIDASNVASDGLVEIPSDVLRGLLRVAGWKCEYQDDLNPHFAKEMGK